MSTPPVCHTCRETIAGYESVHYGSPETGYRDLCGRCFNEEVARLGELNFEHVQFEPVEMMDAAGEPHRFQFCVRLHGEHVALEAFELKNGAPGGYTFEILGDPECDLFALMAQLIERMRRALTRRHLERDEGAARLRIADFLVRGRIEWDENEDGHFPLLVIDGREVTWEQFGQMLMSYEGWQFKLEIKDPSDEV
ncbi:MAG: DUF7713 domain-containing protein [Steroidobacteraceae bacterium]